ncbi:hypothetical protein [Kitasatospora terrestris]|uniref:SseB protein N-terminal domain-containing protein n=1 Tax=Kitasatospora terrestris TaxID=258051 RepID=A0ABP9EK41_9ACTN
MDNAGLLHQLRMMHAQVGDPSLLVAELRAALLYLPHDGRGQVWSGDQGGIRWIYAFSGEEEMAAFAEQRGFQEAELPYLTVRGSRLLEVGTAAAGVPAGVALDAAGRTPMLFPPVRGIVPDEAAVDAGRN